MRNNEDFLKSMLGLEEEKKATAEIIMEPIGAKAQEIDELIKQDIEYQVKKDQALFQTADETKAQTELLENQLRELQEQNELLRKSCSELEKANEQLKEEAAETRVATQEAKKDSLESKKIAKRSNRISIGAIIISSIIGIAAIVIPILIA